jgi:hypothetical protein
VLGEGFGFVAPEYSPTIFGTNTMYIANLQKGAFFVN